METVITEENARCIACGEFPVNHLSTYIDNTLGAWEHDQAKRIKQWRLFAWISAILIVRTEILEPHVIHILHTLSGGKTLNGSTQATQSRARALWQEADRRGIKLEQLIIFGVPNDSYRVFIAGRWVYFEGLPIPAGRRAASFGWADDKLLFKQFLKYHQIPAAEGFTARKLSDAHEKLKQLQLPVVVKPRIGSNSRHTTPLVRTLVQFDEAFILAQELGRDVLFEEYFYGHLCRATLVNGRLVGFLESRQATVTGDGVRTIRELVDEKNAHKIEQVPDIIFTEENVAHLKRQGHETDSVLENGVTVRAVRHPGRGSGGENREMLGREHPKLREYVERTARLLQTPIVGFDLIIDDAEADPDTQKWGILEANTVPFIEIHNDPLYGEPSNVAAAVWDLWQMKS
jgi:cyanophycin synthetase